MSQSNFLVLRSSCLRLLMICSLQVNLLSKCMPKYFNTVPWGIGCWSMYIGGHRPERLVNVTCIDLAWFTFILHLRSHSPTLERWSWRSWDAMLGLWSTATIAMSSAKVLSPCESTSVDRMCIWYRALGQGYCPGAPPKLNYNARNGECEKTFKSVFLPKSPYRYCTALCQQN